jgi:outer membrane lipoprotein-sorting protein
MSRISVRWLVPVAIAAVVLGAGAVTSAIHASATTSLPPRTAAQLVTDLQTTQLGAGIGTLIEHADLGIPALPAGVGGDGSAQFDSLVTGSHTLRIWYDGPQRERVALIGTLDESDIIHNGSNLWIWASNGNKVTHVTLPAVPAGSKPTPPPSPMTITPSAVAAQILAKLAPSTSITSGRTTTVAGRAAYDLVIAPKDPASLIGSIRIAIDAEHHVPLRVQIFAAGDAKPAFEVGFTQINFDTPDPTTFDFNPPPNPSPQPLGSGLTGIAAAPRSGSETTPTLIGSGWTAILGGPMPFTDNGPAGQGDNAIDAIAKALPSVQGPWGSGKVLQTKLFSVLLTSDEHVYLGPVDSSRLLAAVTTALTQTASGK